MNENRKSCWYYDDQLDNRLTSVSLHPNTVCVNGKWEEATKYGKCDGGGYLLDPLCRSVVNEDFNVSIANTWSDIGGDPISGMVNDVMHAAAPYANGIQKAITEIGKKADEWGAAHPAEVDEETGKKKFSLAHQIKGFADWVRDKNDKYGDGLIDFMNSNLIIQGTRFMYYSGTGLSFGNLGMRFTIFPQWVGPNEFLTVNQQLEKLFPYSIGKYEPLVFTTEVDGKPETHASDILGWQRPPAGYRAEYKDIDLKALRGSLKLRIGAFYVLESLVCENLTFSLSRQMVKKPLGAKYVGVNAAAEGDDEGSAERINNISTDTIAFSPLYDEVNLNLRPATKYSDVAMRDFIYGLNIGSTTRSSHNEGAQSLDKKIKSNLRQMQQENKLKYV